MKKILLSSLLVLLTSVAANASNFEPNHSISKERDCFLSTFNSYEDWRAFVKRKAATKIKSKEQLASRMAHFDRRFGSERFEHYKQNIDCSVFEYKVGSIPVKGFVIKPKGSKENLPTLIFNRGGNGFFGAVKFAHMMNRLFPLADEGFVIIGSQYRGTFTKSDTPDEFGGEDVKDVLALSDILPLVKNADTDRVGMFGISRGGMQTHLVMKHAQNIKAIATIAGASDLAMGLAYRPVMEKVYKKRIPNYSENKTKELNKRSVITWVDELSPKVPILLIHGTADKRVSVKHSTLLAEQLSEYKIPHKLVLYKDDDHGLRKHTSEANKELAQWFKAYL